LASILVGLGSNVWEAGKKLSGAGKKKVGVFGVGELWGNFCGRVRITTPSPDLITI